MATTGKDSWIQYKVRQRANLPYPETFDQVQLGFQYLPPELLDNTKHQPREITLVTPELEESIKRTKGNLEACIGRINYKTRKVEVSTGHTRTAACIAAGYPVLIQVKEMTELEAYEEAYLTNVVRRELNLYEEGVGLMKIKELGGDVEEFIKKASKSQNRSKTILRVFGVLAGEYSELHSILTSGVTYTHLEAVAPIPQNLMKKYLKMAAETGIPAKQLREDIKSLRIVSNSSPGHRFLDGHRSWLCQLVEQEDLRPSYAELLVKAIKTCEEEGRRDLIEELKVGSLTWQSLVQKAKKIRRGISRSAAKEANQFTRIIECPECDPSEYVSMQESALYTITCTRCGKVKCPNHLSSHDCWESKFDLQENEESEEESNDSSDNSEPVPCKRCGILLTAEKSKELGIGPECIKRAMEIGDITQEILDAYGAYVNAGILPAGCQTVARCHGYTLKCTKDNYHDGLHEFGMCSTCLTNPVMCESCGTQIAYGGTILCDECNPKRTVDVSKRYTLDMDPGWHWLSEASEIFAREVVTAAEHALNSFELDISNKIRDFIDSHLKMGRKQLLQKHAYNETVHLMHVSNVFSIIPEVPNLEKYQFNSAVRFARNKRLVRNQVLKLYAMVIPDYAEQQITVMPRFAVEEGVE